MTVHHLMLPPEAGKDHGPSACGNPGTTVLFARNVTCPGCSAIAELRARELHHFETEQENAELRAEVERLTGLLGVAEVRAGWKRRVEEAEAESAGVAEHAALLVDRAVSRAEAAEAKVAAVEALADEWEAQPNWREWGIHRQICGALTRVGAADTQPEGATCAHMVHTFTDGETPFRCYRPATHEVNDITGQWIPVCDAHGRGRGVPEDRLRPTPTAGGKVDTAPEACPLDAGERPYWMGVDQYDPCKCLLTKGHEPPCVCSHTAPADSAPESGEGR